MALTLGRARHSGRRVVAAQRQTYFMWPYLRKTPKFATKVLRGVNTKVVDLRTLNNFYKGYKVFFSTVFAQIAAKL
jgi:hypothetical protein